MRTANSRINPARPRPSTSDEREIFFTALLGGRHCGYGHGSGGSFGKIDNVAGATGPRHNCALLSLLALAIHRAVGCAGAEIAGLLQTLEIIEYGRRDGSAV